MSCSTCFSKSGLFIINLLFFGIGGGLIFLGSFMFREYAKYGNAAVKSLGLALLPAVAIIVVGIMACFLAAIGCCAAFRRQKCVKGVYFLMLLIMLLGLIVGGVLCVVYRNKIDDQLHSAFKDLIEKYDSSSTLQAEIDLVQSEFRCCGVDKPEDWRGTPWYVKEHKPYPESCCVPHECTYLIPDKHLNNKGCYALVKDSVKGNLTIIGGTAGGFALILVIGMILTCVLFSQKRKRDREVPYGILPEPTAGSYTPTNGTYPHGAPPPYAQVPPTYYR